MEGPAHRPRRGFDPCHVRRRLRVSLHLGLRPEYRPFIVLEINGKGPREWPPTGVAYNPGPYAILVSADGAPWSAYPNVQHKKPWGVTTLEIASYADRFKDLLLGRLGVAVPGGRRRRRAAWVNTCASCHAGPAGAFGGTKAGRPFQVIAAYAGYDRAFFMKYVRDPKSLVPCAKMEPHPATRTPSFRASSSS